jgi:hypothetical protein
MYVLNKVCLARVNKGFGFRRGAASNLLSQRMVRRQQLLQQSYEPPPQSPYSGHSPCKLVCQMQDVERTNAEQDD